MPLYYSSAPGSGGSAKNTGRAVTFMVAASNATATEIAQADYVCDGTADDVQIQAALNALPSQGGSIRLTSGDYSIASSITLPAIPFNLIGTGLDTTILVLANGANCDMFSYTTATDVTFSSMANMTLEGNSANNTSGRGIYINTTAQRWDCYFRDLFMYDFVTQGFYSNNGHDYMFDHVLVEFCGQASAPTVPALQLDSGAQAGDSSWFNNCLIKANHARGVSIAAFGTVITNCHFFNNGESDLVVNAVNCAITNNTFDDASRISAGMYPNLVLAATASGTTITGNNFYNSGATNQVSYNLVITSGSNNNIVTGNNFTYYATAAVSDSGTGTIYIGNTNKASTYGTPASIVLTNATGTAASLTAGAVTGLSVTSGKTLSVSNSLTLAGTDSTTMTFPSTSASVARTDAAQSFTGAQTFGLIAPNYEQFAANAVTVSSNAGTCSAAFKFNNFTNSSSATMAITLSTTNATDGQPMIVRILDYAGTAETIGWTNTENSSIAAPTTSNGSTTLPLTVGFIYNGQTSKWRCVAVA